MNNNNHNHNYLSIMSLLRRALFCSNHKIFISHIRNVGFTDAYVDKVELEHALFSFSICSHFTSCNNRNHGQNECIYYLFSMHSHSTTYLWTNFGDEIRIWMLTPTNQISIIMYLHKLETTILHNCSTIFNSYRSGFGLY